MVKYTRHRKQHGKQRKHRKSRKSLRKTQRRISRRLRGGYSPIEHEHGGHYGPPAEGEIQQQSGALPDPEPYRG